MDDTGMLPDESATRAEALSQAQQELQTRTEELASLQRVSRELNSTLELNRILSLVLEEAMRVTGADFGNVSLGKGSTYIGRGWPHTEGETPAQYGLMNRAFHQKETLLIEDVRSAEAYIEQGTGSQAQIALPIYYGSEPVGIINLESKQPAFFRSDQLPYLETLAHQSAVVIGEARSFEERKKERERANQRADQLARLSEVSNAFRTNRPLSAMLEDIAYAVVESVGYNVVLISLIRGNPPQICHEVGAGIPVAQFEVLKDSPHKQPLTNLQAIMREEFRLGLAYFIPAERMEVWQSRLDIPYIEKETKAKTEWQVGDLLFVPLIDTDGTVIGLMTVQNPADDQRPNASSIQALEIFANQAAVAIENRRLFEREQQRLRQQAALTEVAQSLNQALTLDAVLNLVLDAVFDLVGEDQGSIWLIETDYIKVANTNNLPTFLVELFNKSDISIEVEPFASVIRSEEMLVLEGDKSPQISTELPLPDNVTYVPLKTEEGVIGILAIETIIHEPNILELIGTVADLAAVAIENARLMRRLNRLTAELEERVEQRTAELAQALEDLTDQRDRVDTLYLVTRELMATLDLDHVLNAALKLLFRAIEFERGSILLVDYSTDQLIYRAAWGREETLPTGGLWTQYKLGQGLAGRVMQSGQARIVADLNQDPDWIPGRKADNRRSAIAIPLRTGDGLMGALLLFHSEIGYFTTDHLQLVKAAGTQIANAINNVSLYQLITDQAERLGTMLQEQAAEAAKNQAILNGIADGVLVLDARRHVVLLNPKTAEILDVDPFEVEYEPLEQILGRSGSPEKIELTQQLYDKLLEALAEIKQTEQPIQFRLESGSSTLIITLSSIALGTEEKSSVVAVIRDVSREAEVERLKNEFISTISHELRTPLTSIKGYTDLLVSGSPQVGALSPIQSRFVEVIQANANRLTNLVNEILEISRIETGRVKLKWESLDIIEIIHEVTVSFEGQLVQKTLELNLNLPENLPPVYTDRFRLMQILTNLIGNAWQYTPKGERINVYAELTADQQFVQIEVKDTGIGIPEPDLPYVFDRFFRSERHEVQVVDGSGLGLSITKSFVEMLGGKIWVNSLVDIGTTFGFTIPIDSNQRPEILTVNENDPISTDR